MSTTRKEGHEPAPNAVNPHWDRLELTVRRLLDDHDSWKRRARAAEKRVQELELALTSMSTGNLDPVALSEQVRHCERENRALLKRLSLARDSVDRIQSRLQFLEEDR